MANINEHEKRVLFACVLVYLPLSGSLICLCYSVVAFLVIPNLNTRG